MSLNNRTSYCEIGTPLFICGYPKSGTTLLLSLLDDHPELLVFPEETNFFRRIWRHRERCSLSYVLKNTGVGTLAVGKKRMTSGERDYRHFDFEYFRARCEQMWDAEKRDRADLLEAIFCAFAETINRPVSKYWVEKTPLNELYLKELLPRWPNLRALYILRDPRDNYFSYRRQRQMQVQARTTALPLLSPAEFLAGWLESLRFWLSFSDRFRDQALLIRYEDLVFYPEATLRKVCDFLRIKWSQTLLQPTRLGNSWAGNSVFGDQYQAVSHASVGRYKGKLVGDDLDFIESVLGSVIEKWGWELPTKKKFPIAQLLHTLLSRRIRPFVKVKLVAEIVRCKISGVI
ncbi:sulfotransferase [Candidatus Parcubacteria bacterium]|nr:MAG: sulfotransferase [Candidatus Parcubacteria bacterium]